MPVLPPEPDRFPEGLFEDMRLLALPGPQWWVMHTRSRQEKCLARHLRRARVPFYLPLIARRCGIGTSYIPLFAGYLFLLANPDERLPVLSTSWVVRSLDVWDQEEFWHDLRKIDRLILSGAPITPENQLVLGTMVEILSVPLAGLRGKLIRNASGRQFVVEVKSIQRGASVLLEDSTLTTVD